MLLLTYTSGADQTGRRVVLHTAVGQAFFGLFVAAPELRAPGRVEVGDVPGGVCRKPSLGHRQCDDERSRQRRHGVEAGEPPGVVAVESGPQAGERLGLPVGGPNLRLPDEYDQT